MAGGSNSSRLVAQNDAAAGDPVQVIGFNPSGTLDLSDPYRIAGEEIRLYDVLEADPFNGLMFVKQRPTVRT